MAWFTRFTRFGDVHQVFGQEQSVSCGLACVVMAAFKINKLQPGTKSLFSETEIFSRAKELFGPNPLGDRGINGEQLLRLLNLPDLLMRGWTAQTPASTAVPALLERVVGVSRHPGPVINVNPAIVYIGWQGGGGHWALVDTVREMNGRRFATVCDPWDANVHVTPLLTAQAFKYTAKTEQHFNVWGSHNYYDGRSQGASAIENEGKFYGVVLYRP